jgi:protein-tyrosine phosphatase
MTTTDYRVLFLCMGNICRSPTAHAVFRDKVMEAGLASRIAVTSAGTHAWHDGSPPDARSQAHARRRGYDLSALRSRPLQDRDFEQCQLLLAMDWDNLALADERCPPHLKRRLRRLTEFCSRHDTPVVPDPYQGGAAGFEEVLDLVEDACEGLLVHVRRQIGA